MNLLLVLLFGLTIFIGTILVLITNKKEIKELSLGIAFSVIVLLITFELIPEALEHINYLLVVLFSLVGIVIIKLLDLFVPQHEHTNDASHVYHIGIITSIALVIHNLIEGMALFTTLNSSFSIGILTGIGIGLHNIPMGMVIGSTLYDKNKNIKKTLLISLLISLSTFLGGLFIALFDIVNSYVTGILLSLTIGVLIYMAFFELLEHLKHQNKKVTIIGLFIGILIFLISLLIH